MGEVGRLDDEGLVSDYAAERRHQLVPLRLLRPERDRDRNDRNVGKVMPDVWQDGADAVVFLEQIGGFDQAAVSEQPGCVLLIGLDGSEDGLEITHGGCERQSRFLEVVGKQDDDLVVTLSLRDPKRVCDQIGRQQVVRDRYSRKPLSRYFRLRGGVDRAQKRIGIGIKCAERRRSFLRAGFRRRRMIARRTRSASPSHHNRTLDPHFILRSDADRTNRLEDSGQEPTMPTRGSASQALLGRQPDRTLRALIAAVGLEGGSLGLGARRR